MIPLMEKELVDKHHWVKKRDFINSIALTQSVPGAIAFNLSIYFGHEAMGFLGAFVSVVAVALPSLLIILAVAVFFTSFSEIEIVQNLFKGIRPAVVSLILYAALNIATHMKWHYVLLIIFSASVFVLVLFSINPIYLIIFAFGLGSLVYLQKKKHRKKKRK